MDELGFDPEWFAFSWPVWYVAEKDQGTTKIAALQSAGGHRCVAVFTDEDLADRFIREVSGSDELRAIPLPSPREFGKFLALAETAGHSHIVVDPSGKRGSAAKTTTIKAAIEMNRKALEGDRA